MRFEYDPGRNWHQIPDFVPLKIGEQKKDFFLPG